MLTAQRGRQHGRRRTRRSCDGSDRCAVPPSLFPALASQQANLQPTPAALHRLAPPNPSDALLCCPIPSQHPLPAAPLQEKARIQQKILHTMQARTAGSSDSIACRPQSAACHRVPSVEHDVSAVTDGAQRPQTASTASSAARAPSARAFYGRSNSSLSVPHGAQSVQNQAAAAGQPTAYMGSVLFCS